MVFMQLRETISNRTIAALLGLMLTFGCLATACENRIFRVDDLGAAKEAVQIEDWGQALLLAQRYLRTEFNADRRWEAWNIMVSASINLGEQRWVVEYLEAMLIEYSGDDHRKPIILRMLGENYEKARIWDKASATWLHLLDIAELAPNEIAEIYRRNGIFHRQRHEFNQAAAMFARCAEEAAASRLIGECWYYQADTYSIRGQLDAALAAVDKALVVRDLPLDLQGMIYLLQGDIYEQQNKPVQAAAAFRAAQQKHPNSGVVRTRLSNLGLK